MSAAHTCFRSALAQAFRPSNRGVAAPSSIPAFLVPALAPLSVCPARSKARHRRLHTSRDPAARLEANELPERPVRPPLRSQIPFPQHALRGDIAEWLAAIESFLPAPARRNPSDDPDISATVTPFDIAAVLDQAAPLDIISHLGLVEGRWQAAVWIAKKLVEHSPRSMDPPPHVDAFEQVLGLQFREESLKTLTEHPIRIERVHAPQRMKMHLDDLTAAPNTIDERKAIVKRGLGKLWLSLGNLILAAAERDEADGRIMQFALEVIAHLHHVGSMPESIYSYRPRINDYVLQQPPTLYMLSSEILTALSDATWRAHEASIKSAQRDAKTTDFLGREIPSSGYRAVVLQVKAELWLELVLWSCLHGGWILDGATLLRRIALKQGDQKWSLISWREIVQSEEQKTSAPSWIWGLFSRKEDASTTAFDRGRTRKTISAEVVSAFVDALVNHMRVGVGTRGTAPEKIVDLLKTLKGFLDAHNLGLGTMAWDSIMARLVESGGLDPEKHPEILMRIVSLAPGFGREVTATNSSASADTELPSFFEPTTLPLSLLHRAMRAFISAGDITGAMETLMLLQQHTDENKQQSTQQFFEMLGKTPPSQRDEPFVGRLPPIDFPTFDTKIPIPLLARLLDLTTESKKYDLGRWLLFSDDLDGPLINTKLRSHRNLAASVVRFGTLAGENDLVLEIIKQIAIWDEALHQQRMPVEVLITLLCCQIQLHRWESVLGMQEYVGKTSTFIPRPIIFSTFASELLGTVRDTKKAQEQAKVAFSRLLFGWERLCMRNIRNELYCILSILSTVDNEWREYCSTFLAVSSSQPIRLSTDDFNRVLGGVLNGYGSLKGKNIAEQWCYQTSPWFDSYRAPGGLPAMPTYRVGKGQQLESQPPNIELVQDSGAKFILQGRILPNRLTILAILRKAKEEVTSWQQRGEGPAGDMHAELRDTVQWAAKMLFSLGYEHQDILRDLGSSLAEIAELEPLATARDEITT